MVCSIREREAGAIVRQSRERNFYVLFLSSRCNLAIEHNLLGIVKRIGPFLIEGFDFGTSRLDVLMHCRWIMHADLVLKILLLVQALQPPIEMHPIVKV